MAPFNVLPVQYICLVPYNKKCDTDQTLNLILCWAGALLDRYADMVKQGVLRPDQHQRDCVVKLSSLCDDLSVYSRVVDEYEQNLARYEVRKHLPIRTFPGQDDGKFGVV